MRRNPKSFAIGTDLWFGSDVDESKSVNGSVRILIPDGQSIPLNHRDLKACVPKLSATQEGIMRWNST
jgi:hypothetical protein